MSATKVAAPRRGFIPTSSDLDGRRRILVAAEDPTVVAFIIKTLRDNGHAVFHAYDGLSATELAFAMVRVDLVISNTKVDGLPGIELIHLLREPLPHLPIMYLANIERSPRHRVATAERCSDPAASRSAPMSC